MSRNWTREQQKVIDTRDKNILVSAAAGSGKTAVLVERIIQGILDKERHMEIDRLLVVTFTNAAAGEMRERILLAIEDELEKDPENVHLQKQQAYIHNASITTIHSFCLNLIRENFLKLDLDPGFTVADENEIELLKSDIVRELLEEEYEKKRPEFLAFVEQSLKRGKDYKLEERILKFYKEAINQPRPYAWMLECTALYRVETVEQMSKTVQYRELEKQANRLLDDMLAMLHPFYVQAENGELGEKAGTIIIQEYKTYESIRRMTEYNERFHANIVFSRWGADKGIDKELIAQAKNARDMCKDSFGKFKSSFYGVTMEEMLSMCQCLGPIADEYVNLTNLFMERFAQAKRKKNIVDFNDFEQFAIAILTKEDENGNLIASETARMIAQQYDEVMIDEYQDSNQIQETILSIISGQDKNADNRFMVGDMKQSIYGFRGARPDIFGEKYQCYTTYKDTVPKESDVKIILDRNFRSRSSVLEYTNSVFMQNMTRELGGIDYDEENKLNVGADYGTEDAEYRTEVLIVHEPEKEKNPVKDGGNPEEEREEGQSETEEAVTSEDLQEVFMIVNRIKELTHPKTGLKVKDSKSESGTRIARYSDVCVLFRSLGNVAYALNDVLRERGIPAHMESKKGYFTAIEIQLILNYLRILDNPMQDYALAAVLKSPIVGLDNNELAILRIVTKDLETQKTKEKNKKASRSLYMDVLDFVNGQEKNPVAQNQTLNGKYDLITDSLREKLAGFLEQLNDLRNMVPHMGIYDLLKELLERTGYYDYVRAMPSGATRKNNIDMLKQQAAKYESGIYKGLFNFIRYIEKMQKYEIDMGEGSSLSETDDLVRIMTIHKSKGLEFPIVIVAGMAKRFNAQDSKGDVLFQKELGMGMDYLDTRTRVRLANPYKKLIANAIRKNTVEEEMRLFYVACTRAKEKLILTSKALKENDWKAFTDSMPDNQVVLPYSTRAGIRSYIELVIRSLCRNQAFDNVLEELGLECNTDSPVYRADFFVDAMLVHPTKLREEEVKDIYVEMNAKTVLENMMTEYVGNEEILREIRKRLDDKYKYAHMTGKSGKMSVSEIKHIALSVSENASLNAIDDMPDFLKNVGAAQDETQEEPQEKLQEELQDEPQGEKNKGIKGAARGTAYHRVFELLDFTMEYTRDSLRIWLDELKKSGRLSEDERKCIREKDLLTFLDSDIGKRACAAAKRGELYKEQQFVMGLRLEEVERFRAMAESAGNGVRKPLEDFVAETYSETEDDGDLVLMQGIIDVFFKEDGKMVLLDYKTDRITKEEGLEKLANDYYVQMELYRTAIEKITNLPVKEKILYSVARGKEVYC